MFTHIVSFIKTFAKSATFSNKDIQSKLQPEGWMLEKYALKKNICYRNSIDVDVVDISSLIILTCFKLPSDWSNEYSKLKKQASEPVNQRSDR
jgi:hypothetical protein